MFLRHCHPPWALPALSLAPGTASPHPCPLSTVTPSHCPQGTCPPITVPKALPPSLGTATPLSHTPGHSHPPLSLSPLGTAPHPHPCPPSLSPVAVPNPVPCPGYFGDSCVSACALDPCEPPGTCIRRPGTASGYACHCPPGTFGALCQHRLVTLWGIRMCQGARGTRGGKGVVLQGTPGARMG